MATTTLPALQKQYEAICNEYVKRFCKKQGLEFEFWVGNTPGGVASCSDYYFNFDDIALDINSKQRKGVILDWYNNFINDIGSDYFSYTSGARVTDAKGSYSKDSMPT